VLTLYSEKLRRDVLFSEIGDLDQDELKAFHDELIVVAKALESAVAEAQEKYRVSGVPLSNDWLHRVNTKKRIVLKFASEVNSQQHGGSTVKQRIEYDKIYKAKFRAMLEEEFGAAELREIERQLVAEAKAEYHAWLSKTKQHAWFIP
jgi:hypothetical protein